MTSSARAATRRRFRQGRADRGLDLLLALRVVRHPVASLAREVWALRAALTAYAAYLALARALDARVLTTDRGLATADAAIAGSSSCSDATSHRRSGL